jgi:energy-coupling factor transporter transmembrane protein EcfT
VTTQHLHATNWLARVDPRAKLVFALLVSIEAFALKGPSLALLCVLVMVVAALSGSLRAVLRTLGSIFIPISLLFLVNLFFLGLARAAQFSVRIAIMSSVFSWVSATTPPELFRLALTRSGVPHRFAFPITLALNQVPLAINQLRMIREAHIMRGYKSGAKRSIRGRLDALVGFATSAIVMTTRRSWEMTETATTRGFESKCRRDRHQLRFALPDVIITSVLLACLAGLFVLQSRAFPVDRPLRHTADQESHVDTVSRGPSTQQERGHGSGGGRGQGGGRGSSRRRQ